MNKKYTPKLSDAISFLALITSLLVAYLQLWPVNKISAAITHTEWSIDKGRLGEGPKLLLGFSIINSGNQPAVLSGISINYGFDSEEPYKAASDCETNSKNHWVGVPWDKVYNGVETKEAMPQTISPRDIVSAIYTFEPANITPAKMMYDSKSSKRVCISFKLINIDGTIIQMRKPLGLLVYSKEKIEDFIVDDSAIKPFQLVH